jgi:hypothetical protein
MPRVGFEPTIPVFEQLKMVHALDCAATVIVRVRQRIEFRDYCYTILYPFHTPLMRNLKFSS